MVLGLTRLGIADPGLQGPRAHRGNRGTERYICSHPPGTGRGPLFPQKNNRYLATPIHGPQKQSASSRAGGRAKRGDGGVTAQKGVGGEQAQSEPCSAPGTRGFAEMSVRGRIRSGSAAALRQRGAGVQGWLGPVGPFRTHTHTSPASAPQDAGGAGPPSANRVVSGPRCPTKAAPASQPRTGVRCPLRPTPPPVPVHPSSAPQLTPDPPAATPGS